MKEESIPAKILVEALHEFLQEDSVRCLDPYDLYVNRIKSAVYRDLDHADKRIQEGYRVILESLASSN